MIGIVLFFGLIFFDLITKALADCFIQGTIVILPGVFQFHVTHNYGMAFSMLSDKEWAQPMFLVLTSVACICFIVAYFKLSKTKKVARLALVFVTAGAIGNFVDRLGMGYVRDFLDIPFFANCNFADLFITVGAILMFVHLLFVGEDALFPIHKKKKDE